MPNRFALVLGLFLTSFVWATSVPRMSFERLVESSEFIVQARVTKSTPSWDAEHRYIWTHYELEIFDRIKSSRPSRVRVSVPGGILDGVRMHVTGTVKFAPGEEVVLFLYRTPIGFLRTNGLAQGKFEVVEHGGRKIVRSNTSDLRLVDIKSGPPANRNTALADFQNLGLEEFKSRIRETVRRDRERRQ